jgi:hypothetical protein
MLTVVIAAVFSQLFTIMLSVALFKFCDKIISRKKGESELLVLLSRKG